jgi:2-phosphosulfolactate phosphatase
MHGGHRQSGYRVRFEWGMAGAAAVASDADVVVIIDVLSFTTTLSVAVDAGIAVVPYRSDDASAETFAREREAVLAVGRSQGGLGQFTLSPASVRGAAVQPQRLVLPSPNGSALARRLDRQAATCVGAWLRNAAAVAAWLAGRHGPGRTIVAVIAAGERWDDGSLRVASEDLWGGGALVAALTEVGWSSRSPEADLALLNVRCAAAHCRIRGRMRQSRRRRRDRWSPSVAAPRNGRAAQQASKQQSCGASSGSSAVRACFSAQRDVLPRGTRR